MSRNPTKPKQHRVTKKPIAAAIDNGSVSQVLPSVSTQQIQVSTTTKHYEGPVPHPDTLRGFEVLVPGTAKVLIDLAVSESSHRRDLETKAVDANIALQKQQLDLASQQTKIVFASDTIGQICGVVVSLVCIAGAVWLAIHDHEVVAGALAAIPTAAVIKAFFTSRSAAPEKPK